MWFCVSVWQQGEFLRISSISQERYRKLHYKKQNKTSLHSLGRGFQKVYRKWTLKDIFWCESFLKPRQLRPSPPPPYPIMMHIATTCVQFFPSSLKEDGKMENIKGYEKQICLCFKDPIHARLKIQISKNVQHVSSIMCGIAGTSQVRTGISSHPVETQRSHLQSDFYGFI